MCWYCGCCVGVFGGAVGALGAAVALVGAVGGDHATNAAVGGGIGAVCAGGGGGAVCAAGAIAVAAVGGSGAVCAAVAAVVNSGWSIGRRDYQCLDRPCNFEANVYYSYSNHAICLSYQFSQGYSCSQPAFEPCLPPLSTLLAFFCWLRLRTTQIVRILN